MYGFRHAAAAQFSVAYLSMNTACMLNEWQAVIQLLHYHSTTGCQHFLPLHSFRTTLLTRALFVFLSLFVAMILLTAEKILYFLPSVSRWFTFHCLLQTLVLKLGLSWGFEKNWCLSDWCVGGWSASCTVGHGFIRSDWRKWLAHNTEHILHAVGVTEDGLCARSKATRVYGIVKITARLIEHEALLSEIEHCHPRSVLRWTEAGPTQFKQTALFHDNLFQNIIYEI